jgi:hypothetical protein
VRSALSLAVFAVLVLAPAPSAQGAGGDRPRVALSVSPAQIAVAAPGSRKINVRNTGSERVVVVVARRAVARDTAGKTSLQILPGRLVLPSGKSAVLTLRVRLRRGSEPGDHQALVLLTTVPLRRNQVGLQVRLGVRVKVRVPGRIVSHLVLGGLRVHRTRRARFVFVSVANRGNVTVQLRGNLTASLLRRGRQVARLSLPGPRALVPGARVILALRYGGRLRGRVTAVVRVRLGPGVRTVERRYRIRL